MLGLNEQIQLNHHDSKFGFQAGECLRNIFWPESPHLFTTVVFHSVGFSRAES